MIILGRGMLQAFRLTHILNRKMIPYISLHYYSQILYQVFLLILILKDIELIENFFI